AVLDQRDRTTDERFRRDVPDDHAPSAAGEAAVGDEADALAEPFADDRGGWREHLAHAGPAARTFIADHEHVAGLDPVAEDRGHRGVFGIEHARGSSDRRILEPRDLRDAAFRREVAFQDREMALRV